ncbi:MAG: hypothetical protein NVSMB68_02810 [Thermoanaerobaculia bacterium]
MQADIAGAIAPVEEAPLAVSPDGRRVATVVIEGKAQKLSIRDLTTREAKTIAGTEGAGFPFWAPDGHAVGFFSGAKLKIVNADSGAIETVCDAPYGRGGAWSPLGVIVFAPGVTSPLMKVNENGGTAVPLTNATLREGQSHRNPAFLPDGKHFLYCVGNAKRYLTVNEIRSGSIDGGSDRKILDYASNMAYAAGWLLTIRDRNLIAQRFDPDALESRGKPVAIAQNIEWYPARWQGTFAVGAHTLVYKHASQPKLQLLRLDSVDGRAAVVADVGYVTIPAMSPDGRRVVMNRFDVTTRHSDLWIYDLAGGPAARLTFNASGGMGNSAVFSPDGLRIALVAADATGGARLWIQPAGGGTQETVASSDGYNAVADWSRDGKTLLLNPQRSKSGTDIDVIRLDGDRKPMPLVHSAAMEEEGRFSPDGKHIAYQSDESGRSEIYVTNYPGATAKWQVSTNGGIRPFWSSDGRQLFFLTPEKRVVVTTVHSGDSFSADEPRPVEAFGDKIVDFAVARNGRMVALREIDSGQVPLSVVLNWKELLRGK